MEPLWDLQRNPRQTGPVGAGRRGQRRRGERLFGRYARGTGQPYEAIAARSAKAAGRQTAPENRGNRPEEEEARREQVGCCGCRIKKVRL